MKFKSKFLIAKTESVEDVYEVMDGTDAVLTSNLDVQIYQGDKISREFDRDSLGASDEINVKPHNVLTYDIEMQSSGAAGTAPAFAGHLLACGLSETINAGVDVVYSLVSTGFKTLSAGFLRKQDNGQQMLVKTTGALGNLAIELGKSAFPMFKFSNMTGAYYRPIEAVPISADTADYIAPTAVTKDNTPTVTLGGISSCFSQFSLDFGNQINRIDAPNCRKTIIADRGLNGSITIAAPDLATKNYFADLESHEQITKLPLIIEHGTAAGKIVKISLPNIQLKDLTQTDVDGELAYQFNFVAVPTAAGDDEFEMTFK